MDEASLLAQIFTTTTLIYAFALVFCICLAVFVHEMGHYVAARLFKVKIRKFSIGFGREILGKTDSYGTRWSWSLWPLGGYVELFGYDSAPVPMLWDAELKAKRPYTLEEKSVAFCYKPLWQRIIIVAMGPIGNFIFALALLTFLYGVFGEHSTRPVINAIGQTSAAKDAGLLPGDHILKLDGQTIRRFEDVWEKSFYSEDEMIWTVRRGGQILEIPIRPKMYSYNDKKGIARSHGRVGAVGLYGFLLEDILSVDGISVRGNPENARSLILERLDNIVLLEIQMTLSTTEIFMTYPRSDMNRSLLDPSHKDYDTVILADNTNPYMLRHSLTDSIWYAGAKIYKFLDESIKFLHIALFGKGDSEPVGGLITMGKITGKALDSGWYMFAMLIVVFSVQIGFINLMPVPVLDGGYLLFFAYEAIAGRPLPAKVQDYALSLGLIALVGIMVIANITDIVKLWH